jgi:asparagine synthase (glutamine-hydrolysing)
MCGIAGIFQKNGRRPSLETVETMGRLMEHRGPDNFACLEFGKTALAHNRLSLLDLSSAANQPFKNEDYALIYNGEIYNFREIRRRLEKKFGAHFQTGSDTEVLFYSLIHEGVGECLKNLRGMFAFAFYDKIKNELWLARDRLGIKPLYYFQKGTEFYWSSEIKALALALDLKPDPLKTLFALNGIAEKSNEYTLFREIVPVKPGSFLKISADARPPEEFFYYKILDDFEPEIYRELEKKSRREIVAEFERLMRAAVERVLISDAPLGAFVSGGIDSSLISAIAAESYPNLKLFTANVVGKYSEYEDARRLAGHLGAQLYDYRFEPEMMLRDWADTTYFYETPIIVHVNAMPFANVAGTARQSSVKAVLTGEGADELFFGYPHLLTRRYDRLAAFPVNFAKSLYNFAPKLKKYLFPNPKQTAIEFANQLAQNFEAPRREAEASEKLEFLGAAKKQEQFFTVRMLGDHLATLLHRNDRMGMMNSIEARFPFLDEELVRFAVNLPAKFKIGRSTRFHNYKHPFLVDKWIVRQMAEKLLPPEIARKQKLGFPMLGHKFVRVRSGFFNDGWVSENFSLDRRAQKFMIEKQDPYFVAKLVSIEIFGRIFGNRENPETIKNHLLSHAEIIWEN